MKLFVAGLPYNLDDAELREIFEKFGAIISARVAIDRETGKSKGFGFVEMVNDADGKDAIEYLKDISLGTKPLVVTQAEERATQKPDKKNDFRRGNPYRPPNK
jgi:cold-inducible RNA-binding protein